jgi:hypothetical protein
MKTGRPDSIEPYRSAAGYRHPQGREPGCEKHIAVLLIVTFKMALLMFDARWTPLTAFATRGGEILGRHGGTKPRGRGIARFL